MPNPARAGKPSKSDRNRRLKIRVALLFFMFLVLGYSRASMQNPVFNINIDQQKLLAGQYKLSYVLEAGGQFWTTPYTRYDPLTQTGDGYGEGPLGPRHLQRQIFNPSGVPQYPFLRMNGLDSQSCFECHNSIGSDPGYGPGTPLIRKQSSAVGGSAGFNSSAFINPCFPSPLTLFIRQPPHVFGSGYVQTISDEITFELYALRSQVRSLAKSKPGMPQTIRLIDTKHNLDYGSFTTTYKPNTPWTPVNNKSTCAKLICPSAPNPAAAAALRTLATRSPARAARSLGAVQNNDLGEVKAPGFTDDLGQIKGVSFDLIIRPFQWKGIASSLRHFVRDALDFHLSMQAVEKVSTCDCDKDGKTSEVSIGNVSAISAFVGMTRPPQQMVPDGITSASVQRGYEIFAGTASGAKLSGAMCATCHTPSLPIRDPNPQFIVDGAAAPAGFQCLSTSQVAGAKSDCPMETTANATSLISPLRTHDDLPVLKRIKAAQLTNPAATTAMATSYNIPLNSTDVPASSLPRLTQTAPFFLPFLQPPAGALYVPLFSDLHTHDMGKFLVDLVAQGEDVAGVCTQPRYFLTRPLWGVADTGPWLHDGRATSLLEAILLHGDSATGSGSEAAPVIDAFEKLSADDKQDVVNFLLSLRLPLEFPQGQNASR